MLIIFRNTHINEYESNRSPFAIMEQRDQCQQTKVSLCGPTLVIRSELKDE